MTRNQLLIIIGASLVMGCSPVAYTTSYLFPIQGPTSTQKPIPVIPASVTGGTEVNAWHGLSGDISFTLPDGETFTGQWSRVPYINSDPNTLALLRESDIKSAWDAVYGEGYYVSNVLGSLIHARAILKGSNGTTIQLEFNNAQPWPTRGVAKDSKNNTYKLVIP